MKIVVLQGSPNKKGSTDILVTEFTRGAEEAGHSVTRLERKKRGTVLQDLILRIWI